MAKPPSNDVRREEHRKHERARHHSGADPKPRFYPPLV